MVQFYLWLPFSLAWVPLRWSRWGPLLSIYNGASCHIVKSNFFFIYLKPSPFLYWTSTALLHMGGGKSQMLPFCVSKEVCLSYLQSQQTCDFLPRTAFYNKKVRLIKAIVLENMRAMHLYLLFPIKRPPGVQWQGGSGCRWLYCSEPRHGNCRVDADTLCSLGKCHRLT